MTDLSLEVIHNFFVNSFSVFGFFVCKIRGECPNLPINAYTN